MIDEIKKIDLNNHPVIKSAQVNKETSQATKPKPKKILFFKQKKFYFCLGIFLFLVTFGFFGVYLPAKKTYTSANLAYKEAKEAWFFAKSQDIVKTGVKIKSAKEKLFVTKKDLQALAFIKYVPIAGKYLTDAKHLVNAGIYGLEAAEIVVESISPYADLLGLKGQGSFVMGSAEERIKKAVVTMDKVTPRLKDIDEKLILIKKEIKDIDPNRYAFSIKGTNVKNQLLSFKELTDQTALALTEARPVFELLPKLLGEPKPVKYLVIFQNDKELRSTGGFITAYAIFKLDEGIVHVEKSDDIYKLDETISNKPKAPEPIMKYLQLRDQKWHLRDTNISPDFYFSMQNFEKILAGASDKYDYEGIIAVDTQFLVKVINILGSIEAYGTKFTTEKVPACNCPQVVYELEKYADQPVNYERGSRKDLIGILLYRIMQTAFSSSPKLYWGKLFQAGLDALSEKHVLIYLKNETAQRGIEALNYAGRIKDYPGDYIHINDTNFGGAKANMFTSHYIEQKTEIKDNGEAITTLTIDYKNPFEPSDCNLEHGQLCLNAPLRNWFRIYVPKGSQLIDSKGSEVRVETYEDLGKTVFDGFLQARPMGTARLTLKYKLPFSIKKGEEYKLLIQKQPGTIGHEYKLNIGGHIEKFKLTIDKELKIKL